jgi:hypothetical protein
MNATTTRNASHAIPAEYGGPDGAGIMSLRAIHLIGPEDGEASGTPDCSAARVGRSRLIATILRPVCWQPSVRARESTSSA